MAAINPFRALRYDSGRIPDLSAVIAPPYDVINDEEQERLYRASPYNIVRLTLGKQSPSDTLTDNRYTRAQREFQAWRRQGILTEDAVAALYLLEHAFDDAGHHRSRLGFIALLQLDEAAQRGVYRHEATLAAPKEDRTRLLERVPANLDPIFCVYPDERGTIQTLLRELAKQGSLLMRAVIHGNEVRGWAITDPAALQTITRHLAGITVLIADGHHRFEVAMANRQRYGALMSYFVSMEDPSLVVRPIHRIMLSETSISLEALRSVCIVEPCAEVESVLRWLEGKGEGRFGFYDGRAFYQIAVSPERLAQWLMAPTVPLPLALLDVSLLHGLILPGMGINGSAVRYTGEMQEALETVTRGGGSAAFLLRGIPLPQVYALAAQGLTLPPKSTFFYPKVPSGLTINPLLST